MSARRLLQTDQARDILQGLLDTGARALLTGDVDLFMTHVYTPHIVLTEDSNHHLRTRSEMERVFFSASKALLGQGVTDYIRIVTKVRIKQTGAICGEWLCHTLQRAHRILPPFPGRGQLVLSDGVWKFSHTAYGICCPSLPDRLPDVSDAPFLRDLNLAR